jgi:hypothetical protein
VRALLTVASVFGDLADECIVALLSADLGALSPHGVDTTFRTLLN